MADVSGLARLKTVPVQEQAYPEPLLEMLLRSVLLPRAAQASVPGAGVQFPQGEGEAFNPAVAYNQMGQRFVRDPYESYSKMSEGGLPQYEDAGVEMDKKDVAAQLSDFSARSFGGGVPGGKFQGHVAEALGPSGRRIVAKTTRFNRGGKVGEINDIEALSDFSPDADNSTDWVRRHYTAREKLIDALKSLPAGAAEGTANLVAIPRSLNDVVARTMERPTGLEGILPTEEENLQAIREIKGGPIYESRTRPGKLVRDVGYFAPWAASTGLRALGSLVSGRPGAFFSKLHEGAGEVMWPTLLSQ